MITHNYQLLEWTHDHVCNHGDHTQHSNYDTTANEYCQNFIINAATILMDYINTVIKRLVR